MRYIPCRVPSGYHYRCETIKIKQNQAQMSSNCNTVFPSKFREALLADLAIDHGKGHRFVEINDIKHLEGGLSGWTTRTTTYVSKNVAPWDWSDLDEYLWAKHTYDSGYRISGSLKDGRYILIAWGRDYADRGVLISDTQFTCSWPRKGIPDAIWWPIREKLVVVRDRSLASLTENVKEHVSKRYFEKALKEFWGKEETPTNPNFKGEIQWSENDVLEVLRARHEQDEDDHDVLIEILIKLNKERYVYAYASFCGGIRACEVAGSSLDELRGLVHNSRMLE
jgi:hypothetical protein